MSSARTVKFVTTSKAPPPSERNWARPLVVPAAARSIRPSPSKSPAARSRTPNQAGIIAAEAKVRLPIHEEVNAAFAGRGHGDVTQSVASKISEGEPAQPGRAICDQFDVGLDDCRSGNAIPSPGRLRDPIGNPHVCPNGSARVRDVIGDAKAASIERRHRPGAEMKRRSNFPSPLPK